MRAQLAFRNRLRASQGFAAEYEVLKRELALRYRDDRPGYTEAKTAFVTTCTAARRRPELDRGHGEVRHQESVRWRDPHLSKLLD